MQPRARSSRVRGLGLSILSKRLGLRGARAKAVLTETVVIGAFLEACAGQIPVDAGVRVTNKGLGKENWKDYLQRRARRYSFQSQRERGLFAVVLLEGGRAERKQKERTS